MVAHNAMDELLSALSVRVSRDGAFLFGGYKGYYLLASLIFSILSGYRLERPGFAEWEWEDKSIGLISTVSDCVDGCIGVDSPKNVK